MAPGGAVVVPSDRKAAILARLDVSVSLSLPFSLFLASPARWRFLLLPGGRGVELVQGLLQPGQGPWLAAGRR